MVAENKPLQTTLGSRVQLDGVGLHGGQPCRLTLAPAPADTGIVWRRIDLPGSPEVPATVDHVVDTQRATTIGLGSVVVRTVEHVMSALAALGVDNAVVELDGEEPPFADGAALTFVQLIQRAGVVSLDAPSRKATLRTPVWASLGNAHIVAVPAPHYRISYTFVTHHPALGTQFADFVIDADLYAREIAPARTVGWVHEVEALRRQGLGRGITKDAAVVVGEDELLTPMRFPNEVARHKVLDIIGDLALAGPGTGMHVVAFRSGHALHVELARRLRQQFTEEDKH